MGVNAIYHQKKYFQINFFVTQQCIFNIKKRKEKKKEYYGQFETFNYIPCERKIMSYTFKKYFKV